MTALGYVISHSETSLKDLIISSCHLGPEGLAALVTEIKGKTIALEMLRYSTLYLCTCICVVYALLDIVTNNFVGMVIFVHSYINYWVSLR